MFKKATKEKAKLRLAIAGPSGAGKSMTSLRIATGIANEINGRIAAIDTERGSLSKYSDRFRFDVCDLESHTINEYVKAINFASKEGYEILLIDSLTHGWHELLQEVERIAKTKFRGNTWSAWSEGTPMQQKLVNAILNYPGHVIATMRTKTEWVLEQGKNGKSVPVRVGTATEQGKGIEYEFDMMIDITHEHYASFTKDRSGRFQDKVYEKPDEKLGKELLSWLNDGDEPAILVASGAHKPQEITQPSSNLNLATAKDLIKSSKNLDDLRANWGTIYKSGLSPVIIDGLTVVKDDRKLELEDLTRDFTKETGAEAHA